jgi:hypothetical protein
VKGTTALHTVTLLERAAGARLAAAYVQVLKLQTCRRDVLERSTAARRALHSKKSWSAFACIALSNHLVRNAAASSELLARRRTLLELGARLAQEKARWANARVGLRRRAARARPQTHG